MKKTILITKYIIDILKNNVNVSTKVTSNNILPLDAIEGTTFPFVIVKRNGISTQYTKDGAWKDSVQFSVIVAAEKYITSVDIAQAIREALEYKHFSFTENSETTEIYNILFQGITEDIINNTYIQMLNFEAYM